MQTSLTTAVNAFKHWASGYPVEERSGEWECDYAQWPHMHDAFLHHLNTCLPASATPGDMADLLYALGRDNETGYLAKALARHKDWFLLLLPQALRDDDADVRWQFALQLGLGDFPATSAEPALLTLCQDRHEYVSRMALQALGRIASGHAQRLCERAWATGHEYQRIMALWVLKEIKSSRLPEYILAAKADGRKFLLGNAIELEHGTTGS